MPTNNKAPRKRKTPKYLKLSQLPPKCYSDGSLCGNFMEVGCIHREAIKDGVVFIC